MIHASTMTTLKNIIVGLILLSLVATVGVACYEVYLNSGIYLAATLAIAMLLIFLSFCVLVLMAGALKVILETPNNTNAAVPQKITDLAAIEFKNSPATLRELALCEKAMQGDMTAIQEFLSCRAVDKNISFWDFTITELTVLAERATEHISANEFSEFPDSL